MKPPADMKSPEPALEMLWLPVGEGFLSPLAHYPDGLTWETDPQADKRECPLSGVKRTSLIRVLMSANDPKRTFEFRNIGLRRLGCGTLRAPCPRMVLSVPYDMEH